ncbi:unnamed protein product [Arabidopsis halleri]
MSRLVGVVALVVATLVLNVADFCSLSILPLLDLIVLFFSDIVDLLLLSKQKFIHLIVESLNHLLIMLRILISNTSVGAIKILVIVTIR